MITGPVQTRGTGHKSFLGQYSPIDLKEYKDYKGESLKSRSLG